jgi:hypothetical protein
MARVNVVTKAAIVKDVMEQVIFVLNIIMVNIMIIP